MGKIKVKSEVAAIVSGNGNVIFFEEHPFDPKRTCEATLATMTKIGDSRAQGAAIITGERAKQAILRGKDR
jgi:membrane peptidoglycan carboxypeptidase